MRKWSPRSSFALTARAFLSSRLTSSSRSCQCSGIKDAATWAFLPEGAASNHREASPFTTSSTRPDQLLRASIGVVSPGAVAARYSILRGKDLETGRVFRRGTASNSSTCSRERVAGVSLNLQNWREFLKCWSAGRIPEQRDGQARIRPLCTVFSSSAKAFQRRVIRAAECNRPMVLHGQPDIPVLVVTGNGHGARPQPPARR